MQIINIYTDGACKGNPGDGGLSYMIEYDNTVYKYAQGELNTTNNRMEVNALLLAFVSLNSIYFNPDERYLVNIYSDSKYVIDAFSKNWLCNWVRRGFLNVKNTDLWQRLFTIVSPIMLYNNVEFTFNWIKGHSGHEKHDVVDKLARDACGKHGVVLNYFYKENVST